MNRKQQRTKMFARVLAIIVALAMIMMSGYYLLMAFSAGSESFFVYAAEDMDRLDALKDVLHYIDENYADDITLEYLTDAAYNGVFDALDQWSVYYKTSEEKNAFLTQVTGNYAGIGITMSLDGAGRCMISKVNTLGPAYEAGIKMGTYILSVDGVPTESLTLDKVSAMVRGDAGTQVTLELEFEGERQTLTLERRRIKAQTVEYKMLEGNIGYISISQFSGDSWREFRTAKILLIADGMEKMILDIRNNGGGLMSDALNVAGLIVPQGKPLVFYEQQGEIFDDYYSPGGTYKDVPLVLLINSYTASASECLAAAIKDNGCGTLVGETTYGKGVAQELVTMNNGESFKLTFCHFLTPKKQRIDGVGIAPDVAVFNGAAMTAQEIAEIESELLPMTEGRKYYEGQIGLTVLAAQQRLKCIGYDVLENARMDEKTVAALKKIQALYGACPYGGLDFCTIDLVQRAFDEYFHGDGTDRQLQKAIEILQ